MYRQILLDHFFHRWGVELGDVERWLVSSGIGVVSIWRGRIFQHFVLHLWCWSLAWIKGTKSLLRRRVSLRLMLSRRRGTLLLNVRLAILEAALLFVYGGSMLNFRLRSFVAIDQLHMLEIERVKTDDASRPLFNDPSFLVTTFLFLLFVFKDRWEVSDDFTLFLRLQDSFLYEIIC